MPWVAAAALTPWRRLAASVPWAAVAAAWRDGLPRSGGTHLTGRADAARRGSLGLTRLALGLSGPLLGGADPLEHLAQSALALGLLGLELCQPLGAGSALFGFLRPLLDLLQTPVGILHRALTLLALRPQAGFRLLHRTRKVLLLGADFGAGALLGLVLEPGGVQPHLLLSLGVGALLGLAASLLGGFGNAGIGLAAGLLDRLPGSLLDLVADALGLLPGPLLRLPAQALGLLPDPLLNRLAGLLLGLATRLLGGHPDQLLGLLLGALGPILGLALEPLGSLQALLDLPLDKLFLVGGGGRLGSRRLGGCVIRPCG